MAKQIIHSLSLGAVLFAVWLLLSGHYTPFILILGVVSCITIVTVTLRMEVADREGHPIHLTWRALTYMPWLMIEIIKANFDVAKRVLSPSLPMPPTLLRVKASQSTDLGQVTPGTISVDVANNEILVHALSREGAESLLEGMMDKRVTRMSEDSK